MSGIKIDVRDRYFSLAVRERANNLCESCNATSTLQCAHIQGRRHKATRWLPMNGCCLCYACHRFFTEHPIEFWRWLDNEGLLTSRQATSLIALSHTTPRFRKPDLEQIKDNLKREYEFMIAKRIAGETGRLEFGSPYP